MRLTRAEKQLLDMKPTTVPSNAPTGKGKLSTANEPISQSEQLGPIEKDLLTLADEAPAPSRKRACPEEAADTGKKRTRTATGKIGRSALGAPGAVSMEPSDGFSDAKDLKANDRGESSGTTSTVPMADGKAKAGNDNQSTGATKSTQDLDRPQLSMATMGYKLREAKQKYFPPLDATFDQNSIRFWKREHGRAGDELNDWIEQYPVSEGRDPENFIQHMRSIVHSGRLGLSHLANVEYTKRWAVLKSHITQALDLMRQDRATRECSREAFGRIVDTYVKGVTEGFRARHDRCMARVHERADKLLDRTFAMGEELEAKFGADPHENAEVSEYELDDALEEMRLEMVDRCDELWVLGKWLLHASSDAVDLQAIRKKVVRDGE